MTVKIFSTLTKKKENLKPLKGKDVKLFVCGVTEYDHVHLGHARTYSFYDTLVRFLRAQGYNVTYLQNITDVGHLTEDTGEDKVEKKAISENKTPQQIVDFFLRHHLENFDRLGLLRPDLLKKATDHIPEIINQVKEIIDNGYAYVVNGSVYFDVSKFKDYGKLSKKISEELIAGARVDVNIEKEDPRDFALWIKAPKTHLQKWNSPWGIGYPGWHIEDTAIALKYFGPQYDIHGGAIELAFPHHEAEIAQAEATTGKKPYVKYWVHGGILTINNEKMAKSKGNFVRLVDALNSHSPESLRMWIASTHYRKPLDYNEKEIEDANKKVEKIANVIEKINDAPKKSIGSKTLSTKLKKSKENFMKAMEDDMNTPLAISHLLEIVSVVNKSIDSEDYSTKQLREAGSIIEELGSFFQIIPSKKKEKISDEIRRLIELREKARKNGDFATADKIRDRLRLEFKIILEDRPSGVKWKRA
jgi:cysteinyl-tRNA synthetase